MPRARSASLNPAMALYAPRSLKERVRCQHSSLRKMSQPASALSASDRSAGVPCAVPAIRCCAALISSSVGLSSAFTGSVRRNVTLDQRDTGHDASYACAYDLRFRGIDHFDANAIPLEDLAWLRHTPQLLQQVAVQ